MLLYDDAAARLVRLRALGTWLIWLAAVLTVWSMLYYLRRAWPCCATAARAVNGRADAV